MRQRSSIAVGAAGRRCNECRRLPSEAHEVWCHKAPKQRTLKEHNRDMVSDSSTVGAWSPAVYGFVPNCGVMAILVAYPDARVLQQIDKEWWPNGR